MISKVTSLRSQAKVWSRILSSSRKNYFSTASADEAQLKKLEELVNLDKQLKDEHYEDLIIKFKREWNKIHDRVDLSIGEVDKSLDEIQKKRVEMLAQSLLELNIFEMRYFSTAIRDQVKNSSGISNVKLNIDWPTVESSDFGTWPANNPNWFLQQEAIARLWPLGQQGFAQMFGGAAFGSGSAGEAGQQEAAAAPKEEAQPAAEEKAQAKDKFDIELNAIDASKKIAIIKEVRELLKLGLKEAKEMVEKAPVVLKRDVKKEEAEQLKEKLAGLGCTINLL